MRDKVTRFYQVAHYGGYFDVSTADVLFRLRKALWPFCAKTKLLEDERYDCYGPIWIMVTLIVEITIIGFVNYQIDVDTMMYEIKHGKVPTNYMELYSLQKVARAAFVLVGYFLLNPLMLLLLCRYVAWIPDIKFLYIYSIYGYSFTIFILTIALTVIPTPWMNWVVLIYSGINSMLAIFIEMYDLIKTKLK
jgi:hypothetical protein